MQDKFRNVQKPNSFESINDIMSEHVGNRKVKKFFKIAGPILIFEIIAIIALSAFLLIIPKNFCKISINLKDAVIYVNNEKTNKFKFNPPDNDYTNYYYEVDICVKLPGNELYNVTYTVECEKYNISLNTPATKSGDTYSLKIRGGEKTQIISAIIIKPDEKIENFDVKIKIIATKI